MRANKFHIIFFICLLFVSKNIYSQDLQLEWLQAFGADSDVHQFINKINLDNNDNLYIVGRYKAAVDFDTGPDEAIYGNNTVAQYLMKKNSNGDFLWFVDYRSPSSSTHPTIQDYAIDNQGNVYLVGSFVQQFDANPGTAEYWLGDSPTAGGQTFFIKLDTNGNLIWARHLSNQIGVNSIALDNSDNIIIVGQFNGTKDFDPSINTHNLTEASAYSSSAFSLKLNNHGDFISVNHLVSDLYSIFYDVKVDNLDNVYYLGRMIGNIDADFGLGVTNITSNTTSLGAYFVIKTDDNNNFTWEKRFDNENGTTNFRILELDNNNDLIIGGYNFKNTIDVDPGPNVLNINNPNTQGVLAIKLDTNGNYQWYQSFTDFSSGGVFMNDMKTDANNNLYLCGVFYGTSSDFDDSNDIDLLSASEANLFINKTKSNGDYDWTFTINDANTNARALGITSSNNIILGGGYIGTVDFDPSVNIESVTSEGIVKTYQNAYLLKYSQPALSIESSNFPNELILYPNPMENRSVINLQKKYQNVSIKVIDNLGRIVQKEELNNCNIISIKNIKKSGVYFIHILADNKKADLKLIKR